jgi:cobalt-zinc-cadmium efflux system outer membrane protein
MMRIVAAGAIAVWLACGLWACAAYTPAPLQPDQTARRFVQRTLSDRGLCDYLTSLEGNLPAACPPARWDLAALTLVGFFYSPDLAVARAKLAVATAAITTSGERPNPSIGLGPQYAVGGAPSFVPWAIGAVQMNFPIETAGRRRHRVAQAEDLAQAAAFAVGEAAWRVRSAVRAALANCLVARQQDDLAQAYASTSRRIAQLLQQRLEVGDVAAPATDFALANLASAQLRAAQARTRVPDSLNTLAAALGVPVDALAGATLVWPHFAHPPRGSSLTPAKIQRLALLDRIDLRRMLAQYAAADEALKLEIARQYPNINLAGGYSWEVNENIFELLPVVTLPLMNQNQGPIAEARARRVQAAAEFVALQDAVIAQASGALTRYRGALEALAQATRAAAFAAKRLAATRRAAQLGDSDSLTLASAQLAAIIAQQSRLSALASAQNALGTLEDAVQRPLEDGDLQSFSFPPSPPTPTDGQTR